MKIRKKILMILPNLKIGGAEKISITVLNNLPNNLFKKYLIVFSKKGKNIKNLNKNINIINLDNPRLSNNIFKIIMIIFRKDFDVIFSSFYHINIFLGFLKYFFNFKLIIRESNDPNQIIKNHTNKFLLYYLYKYFYPKADKIILPAMYLKNRLKEFLIPNFKLRVIYNPISFKTKINKYKKKNFFCAVGRLTYQKGFDDLIKIVNESKIKKLFIIGSGKEKYNLLKISNKKKIKFLKETIPDKYILSSKALLFSSRWEGMPNIALEALNHGTKIISISKIDSIKELQKITKKGSIIFSNKKNFNNAINHVSKIKFNNKNLLPKDFDLDFAIKKYQKELY